MLTYADVCCRWQDWGDNRRVPPRAAASSALRWRAWRCDNMRLVQRVRDSCHVSEPPPPLPQEEQYYMEAVREGVSDTCIVKIDVEAAGLREHEEVWFCAASMLAYAGVC